MPRQAGSCLSCQTLGAMEPSEAYWAVLDPIWDEVSIYDGVKKFTRDFERANPIARTLFAAHWCESEVSNGGFRQFFANSAGILAPEALAAFRNLGMPRTAAIVEQAIGTFGPEYPRGRKKR